MGNRYPVTRFGLLRHAETHWNREKRIQGHSNSALTSEGKLQAEKWGRLISTFQWDRIITSDLGRALETATRANLSLNLFIDREARLREQNWGRWEGKKIAALKAEERLNEQMDAGWAFCPPEGEDRETVWERGRNALSEAAAKWPGKNQLVITHEGMIKCLVYRLCGREFLPTEPSLLRPHHLHVIRCDEMGLQAEEINAMALF